MKESKPMKSLLILLLTSLLAAPLPAQETMGVMDTQQRTTANHMQQRTDVRSIRISPTRLDSFLSSFIG